VFGVQRMTDRHLSSRSEVIILSINAPEGGPFLVGWFREVAQKQRGLSQENLKLMAWNVTNVICRALKFSSNTLSRTHIHIPRIHQATLI
jgi:hypothetical protein